MASFSVRGYLLETYGISIKGGGNITCPFCQHKTMSVTKDDQLAKCFHPRCGRYITSQSIDGEKNPVQGFLWELASLCKQELMRQAGEPNSIHSVGWQYLTQERRIEPKVLEDSLLGIVLTGLDLGATAAPYREKMEVLLQKAKGSSKKQVEKVESLQSNFKEVMNRLEECLYPGRLAFFYTSPDKKILSIRFREPYSKQIWQFKPFLRSGVFDPQLYDGEKMIDFPAVLLAEGEFNILMLQSVLFRVDQRYWPAIALGSASSVDWHTLKRYKGQWLLFQDHDEAGEKLAEEMQEHRTFRITQAPMIDDDLDTFLKRFSSPQEAITALLELISKSKTCYRTITSISREIHEIRQNRAGFKEFEVNQKVARIVVQELKDRGTFYKTKLAPYYFDGETRNLLLIHKESQGILHLLHQMYLNPVETIHGYLLRELVNEAWHHGQQTDVYDLFHYQAKSNTLYWANGNQDILKITEDKIETVPNGTDGFLFLENPKYEPFEQVAFKPDRNYLADLLLNQANFNEEALLTPDEQRVVLQFYFFSLFFGSIMKTRPILCPVAEKGSGKTSLLRRIGQLLMGHSFDVTPLPDKKEDFHAALANNFFLAYDNVDEKSKWLNDTLAICATGGTIKLRTLYTTKEETEIRISTFVALNSRTPNYRRDDVAERLLLLYLKTWGDKKRQEGELNRELLDSRNEFLSWLIVQLQGILKALASVSGHDFRTSFRVADFAAFCHRIAKHQGDKIQVARLFEKLSTTQAQFTLETDPLYECLELLSERYSDKWFNAKELHQNLTDIAQSEKLSYTVRNPVSLGKIIKQLKSSLEVFMDIQIRKGHSNKFYYSFRPKQNNHPNHPNHPNHVDEK